MGGHKKLHAQILEDQRWTIAKKHKWNGEKVDVRKSIIGGNVWFVSDCPECNETNTIFDKKSKLKYDCEECGLVYEGEVATTKVVVAKTKASRKQPTKKGKEHLLEIQHNSCYWCHREFGF